MMKVSRIVYFAASSLFLFGVAVQVFLVGMVVVAFQIGWSNHRDLGHTLAFPLLVMLVFAYLGHLPRRMKWLTWSLFAVYVIQADVLIFLRTSLPVASAFHPVLALVDAVLAVILVYQAWNLVRTTHPETTAPAKFEQLDKIGL
jgi:uncharacterized membrane protein